MKKIKCKVCNYRFPPTKEAMYLASESATLTALINGAPKTFECFDCPKCGAQITVGIRIPPEQESCVCEEDADE